MTLGNHYSHRENGIFMVSCFYLTYFKLEKEVEVSVNTKVSCAKVVQLKHIDILISLHSCCKRLQKSTVKYSVHNRPGCSKNQMLDAGFLFWFLMKQKHYLPASLTVCGLVSCEFFTFYML